MSDGQDAALPEAPTEASRLNRTAAALNAAADTAGPGSNWSPPPPARLIRDARSAPSTQTRSSPRWSWLR